MLSKSGLSNAREIANVTGPDKPEKKPLIFWSIGNRRALTPYLAAGRKAK